MLQLLLSCLMLTATSSLWANVLKDNPQAISTKKVHIKKHKKEEFQVAEYSAQELKKINYTKKLRIETCLDDRYGIQKGLQIIYYGKKAISESDKIRFEKIGNKEYVVHSHPYWTVYTRDKTQYIVLKK